MFQDTNREPSLLESLNRIIEAQLCDLHVALPAIVQKYDATTQLVDVKPVFKRVYLNDDDTENPIEYPVITDVPVAFPQGGGCYLTFPLAVGDRVLLVFSQRSLDAWKETDGKTVLDPGDTRRHHLTDAVAFAGVSTPRNPITSASSTDVVLGVGGSAKVMLGAKDLASGYAIVRLSDLQAMADTYNGHDHPHPFGTTSQPVQQQNPTASSVAFAK